MVLTKMTVLAALVAGAHSFAPLLSVKTSTALFNGPEIGAGGMADTRNPDAYADADPRKSISAAPSFEEYLKSRGAPAASAPAPAAPAPVAPAPVAPAPAAPVAAAPAAPQAAASGDSNMGQFDDQLWDNDAKKIVYGYWDPNAPRSVMNFNPFETYEGNSPDASGRYPGEPFYKDPMRGDVNFASMQAERAEAEERAANPKPGHVPGCPGCRDGGGGGGAAPAAPAAQAAPAWGAPAAPVAPAAPAWGAPAAPAAAAPAAPAAAAPAGGATVVDTLATLEGPGQVWGADGIAVGKEESDFKCNDNFGKFYAALQSTGVAAELAGAGPFTVFAPTDPAMETYELMRGPVDANVVKLHIVPGLVPSSDVGTADLTTLAGTKLTYRYAVRKHFVNDAIIGETTFGIYANYPIDVQCSNGIIHAVGLNLAM